MKIDILFHSSIRFELDNKVIYFDPYEIDSNSHDADIIFITHSHFDHYSKKDINKVIKDITLIVEPLSMKNNDYNNVIYLKPNESTVIDGIKVDAVPSYNNKKNHHRRSDNFLGYILLIDNETYYVMGDCDENEDNLKLKVDNLFIPIGGTYTFDCNEAIKYVNKTKPNKVYPHHLAFYKGDKNKLLEKFKKSIDKNIKIIM